MVILVTWEIVHFTFTIYKGLYFIIIIKLVFDLFMLYLI